MKTNTPNSTLPTTNPLRIVIAGGSGFLGTLLAQHHAAQGNHVTLLTRKPHPTPLSKDPTPLIQWAVWDGSTLGPWTHALEESDVLINLAGRSVNCRYNERNRTQILYSRTLSTRILGAALSQCQNPPTLWINSSTATIYSHTEGPAWTESGTTLPNEKAHDSFSIHVAKNWESTFFDAHTPGVRKIALRLAMVLGEHPNSVWPIIARLVRLRLGGRWSDGRQYMSWIHAYDFCKAIDWLINHTHLSGPINLAAPEPVTNEVFMRTARKALNVPWGIPSPKWLLEVGAFFMRTETELLIKSRRVIPDLLEKDGFRFEYPNLDAALNNLAHSTCPIYPIDARITCDA